MVAMRSQIRFCVSLMEAGLRCSICGEPLSGDEHPGRPVAADVRAFVDAHGLDGERLCAACSLGVFSSPCVSLCSLDYAKRFCRGCGRTVDEIQAWRRLNSAARCAVLLRLRPRRTTR